MTDDSYHVTYDAVAGVVRATPRGYWSLRDAEGYVSRLAHYVNEARRDGQHVRLLVDCRDASVQAAEVAEHLRSASQRLLRSTDRTAILAGSQLLRMQLRRTMDHAGGEVFLNLEDAMSWLEA